MTSIEKMVSSEPNAVMGQAESGQKPEGDEPMEEDSVTMEDTQETNGGDTSNSSSSKVLEWNFIDFSKAERCPIYDVDPVMLKKFVGHNVTVYNTSREEFHGCCLAIDPVSLSVILGKRVPEGKIRITALPGYHLSKIFVNPESVPPEAQVSVNDLDIAELYHAPSLLPVKPASEAENGNDNNKSQQITDETSCPSPRDAELKKPKDAPDDPPNYSESEVEKRKETLKELLAKHKMPFTDKGGAIELPAGVKIEAPYTIESCNTKGNQMIKKKLGELILSIK